MMSKPDIPEQPKASFTVRFNPYWVGILIGQGLVAASFILDANHPGMTALGVVGFLIGINTGAALLIKHG